MLFLLVRIVELKVLFKGLLFRLKKFFRTRKKKIHSNCIMFHNYGNGFFPSINTIIQKKKVNNRKYGKK